MDLSRKKVDVCLLSGEGEHLDQLAAPPDADSLLQHLRQPDRQFARPRVDRSISNLKNWLQGTHHGVSPEHMQAYLDEFVFRHNRRRTPLAALQTLLGLAAATSPPPTSRSRRHRPLAELTG